MEDFNENLCANILFLSKFMGAYSMINRKIVLY